MRVCPRWPCVCQAIVLGRWLLSCARFACGHGSFLPATGDQRASHWFRPGLADVAADMPCVRVRFMWCQASMTHRWAQSDYGYIESPVRDAMRLQPQAVELRLH